MMKLFLALIALLLLILAFYSPVHAWLHAHLEFLFGFAVGTWLEMFVYLYEKRHEYKV